MQMRHGKICEVSMQGMLIQESTDSRGYKHVCLWRDNKQIGFLVHRLVAEAFLREIGEDEEINHLDCDKNNNVLDNLEITTRDRNISHAAHSGRLARKLTDATVREIRHAKLWGDNNKLLARRFNVTPQLIRVVVAAKVWKHVDLSEWQLGHD